MYKETREREERIMSKKSVLIILLLWLGLSIANAAYISPGWNYGYELGVARGDNQGSNENFAPIVRGHVQLQILPFLYLRGGLGYTHLSAKGSLTQYDTNSLLGDYRFIVKPFEKKWSPFIFAGSGMQIDMNNKILDFIPMYPFGIGVQTPIKKGMLLELTGAYNLTNTNTLDGGLTNSANNWLSGKKQDAFYSITAGLTYFNAGPEERKPAPVPKVEPVVVPAPAPTPPPKPVEVQVTPPPPPVKPVVAPDPKTMDSDGDGLTDYDEVNVYKTDPKNPDTDGDGLKDGAEVLQYKTDPLNPDTDGDGLKDGAEVMQYKTNPLNPDTDGDGLKDGEEVTQYKTDPLKSDTDGDGLNDGAEVLQYKTNPLNPDTDNDGLKDGAEVQQYKTNPLNPDTDNDGLKDGEEVSQYKTDPLNPDTDNDGLKDGEEVSKYKTNPLDRDTDKGTKPDGEEVATATDPLDPKDDIMVMKEGTKFSLEGIVFETAKATLLPASIEILDKAYAALVANPQVKVQIVGHTDNVGSASSNLTLSQKRAEAVMAWLVKKGIAADRMTAMGKGLTEPRATNATPEGRQQNRRIEFVIVEQ